MEGLSMQKDMHYYGTYAMARAAGLKPQVCKTIATCAQFVDDNAANIHIDFLDGGKIYAQPTAHHLASVSNIDPEDQRRVWVPFHFLPGNQGNSFSGRLRCVMDSKIATDMIDHHLNYADHNFGIHLIGITAHVYADTFSHYGFSGVGSRRNKVINDSIRYEGDLDPDIRDYIDGKAKEFYKKYRTEIGFIANMKSWIAETLSGALGHGAVATYPDRPYLVWSFIYESSKRERVMRNNPEAFIGGCQALHDMFVRFGKRNHGLMDAKAVAFSKIRKTVKEIISCQGSKEKRINCWRQEFKAGTLGNSGYHIPIYNPEPWLKRAAKLNGKENSTEALATDIYRFYQAASLHRNYIRRDLLPSHGIVVS